MSAGYYKLPGYRATYTCMELQKLEEVISKHECTIEGIDPSDDDILYACKSSARPPAVPTISALAQTPTSARPTSPGSQPSSVSRPSATPPAQAPTEPDDLKWAIQVGSYSSRKMAQELTDSLLESGQPAFLIPVTAGQGTLYRVRVGPFDNRETAASTLPGVKAIAPLATVVRH